MEIKEGMYVRFYNGEIGKIHKYKYDEEFVNGHTIYLERDTSHGLCCEEKDFKASYNIIDLIEEGDYVNGFMVMEAGWNNDDLDYEEGLAIPMYSSDDLDVIENWQPLKYMKIKSIVTREQFESLEYKVVE